MPQHVRDVMTTDLVTVEPQTSVTAVARKMRDENIGAVLVTEGDRLRGLVSDRDLVVRAVAKGGDLEQTTVAGACSEDLVTVGPDDDVKRAVEVMREHAVRRVPVVDKEQHPVGVVSIGDLAIERDPESALGDISAAEPNR
ncbi:CBS domain-containing protein [Streptomyces ipomoeae]|jgi:CBS domain-containing protein|uniref:CBS domain protein n=2 Tax=Streptomyces ipomoeae TaxID=103232 RepID=L1L145_9ACTN|nr:CBS domain-containing protein [Streptomyces ipomoeae]EKX66323.1 CBS domain protein [Streptomyces ipomoeae 91-03]MDX2696292.1 CBS domain-containing protein [Streptomyces ipomoeae]MDX2823942.1 CBS domain-containing protein [Streptomyces ipomoeae]MDX2842061.1 CBS domain-containing protein [Streptomyces ipomoeae]MDX2876526.1 CBS domain-containing protein [Streptomyces ipomoeae]